MKQKQLLKIISLLLVATFAFGIVGCSSNSSSQESNTVLGNKDDDKVEPPKKEEPPKTEVEPPKEVTPPTETSPPKEEIKPQTPPPQIVDTNLNNNKISWWFVPNKEGKTPGINTKIGFDIKSYDGVYVGDTSRKVLYLTMDEGYENGYTSEILDILKRNNVKATFFVTSPYIKSNPELIKRMVSEGHIVGNHSKNHPSMPSVTSDQTKFNNELNDVEKLYKDLTGKNMPKYFRPPMGEYSEKSMAMTKNLGYKTVFWSFAYNDWDVDKQPDKGYAKQKILDGLHPGAVLLLHAVSKTNTEILEEVIKEARAKGYEFELLP
ncbi:MAG: delta-lactam-biosynthetic de-N-acetylase [Clostridium sp.]